MTPAPWGGLGAGGARSPSPNSGIGAARAEPAAVFGTVIFFGGPLDGWVEELPAVCPCCDRGFTVGSVIRYREGSRYLLTHQRATYLPPGLLEPHRI